MYVYVLEVLSKYRIITDRITVKEKTAFREAIASSIIMRKTVLVSRSIQPFFRDTGEFPSIIYAN